MDTSFESTRNHIFNLYNQLQDDNQLILNHYLLELFQFQYKYNEVYHNYCKNLQVNIEKVNTPDKIPYLPISAFKHYAIKTGTFEAEEIFMSSGTTGTTRSKHHVKTVGHYLQNTEKIWNNHFGSVESYCYLALLPGYLDREGSSLISMVNHFINKSLYTQSGFYIRDHEALHTKLLECQSKNIPTVLFGVPYALLDFIEKHSLSYPELIIIETGGMKGQRAEMSKEALHQILCDKFGVQKIYSEYGMTELLSQSYTKGGTHFISNQNMVVSTHQIYDPLSQEKYGKTGILCIADTANIDSCAFIQTEDIGKVYENGNFEIIGRLDISDIRGCNLLIEELNLE